MHIVKPFEIPRDWLKFRAMDFGQARPYAVLWFAVNYDGDIFVYRELYGWNGKPNVGTGETAKQIAEKILELETREEDVRYGVLDSACWSRNGVTGPTISEELNTVLTRKGYVAFMPSSKGRMEGANAFKQRLIGTELQDGTYKPAIKFFSTCIHCIRTIPMIGHDKHKPELPDTDAEDHCFVAGTLIHTKRGEVPIEEVTTDDDVLTRKGYRKVLAAGMTRRKAKVITVVSSNGRTLTGTPNHPIFVKGKGFITLDTVNYGDMIYGISEVNNTCRENNQMQQNQSYTTALLLSGTLTQRIPQIETIIEQTGVSTIKESFTCIEKFGKRIMAKSPKDTTYITRTGIRLIMIFLILSYSRSMNISRNTYKKILPTQIITSVLKTIWLLSDQKPPSGTGQKKGESGTANTELNARSAKLKSQKSNVHAYNVGKSSIPQVTGVTAVSIAPPHVAQSIAATMGLTTRPGPVSCAAKNSELIVSAKTKLVVENAEVSVVAIREENKTADVYNLTVDGEHEYFANGFLVHNCYDACAYGVMSRPYIPVKKGSYKTRDAWDSEEKPRSVWTL